MASYERSPKGQVRRPSRPEHVVAFEFLRMYYDQDESDDGALQKSDVYEEYQNHCKQHGHKPLVAADFGRVLKSVFPNSRDRRLGSRGSSKYCYVGVKRRDSCRSPLLVARAQAPVTEAELRRAYEVVICEWASTVLSRRLTNLRDLATYLLGQRFVQTRSCSALTIMSAHKESVDRLHLETPLNKHRETQLKLQEKLLQRMSQRGDLLSSSSPTGGAPGDSAAASPAFSSLHGHDGIASRSNSPLHQVTTATATKTNTAPSSCRSTPIPPSSCESSARSTPMGSIGGDVFLPSTTPSSVQPRPTDLCNGNSTGNGSLVEAFASAWADANGESFQLGDRWLGTAGYERRHWPSAAVSSGVSARLMVRSEPCTPTPWQRTAVSVRPDELRGEALASFSSMTNPQPYHVPAGFQPLGLTSWHDNNSMYVESCPGSTVSSPTATAPLSYDVSAESGGVEGLASQDHVFQHGILQEDSAIGHAHAKAAGSGEVNPGQLLDDDCAGSVPQSVQSDGGSGLYGVAGLFDTPHASAFVPVGRALGRGACGDLGLPSNVESIHIDAGRDCSRKTDVSNSRAIATMAASEEEINGSVVRSAEDNLGAELSTADADFADILSIINSSIEDGGGKDCKTVATMGAEALEQWHLQRDMYMPPSYESHAEMPLAGQVPEPRQGLPLSLPAPASMGLLSQICAVQPVVACVSSSGETNGTSRLLQISLAAASSVAQHGDPVQQQVSFNRLTSCVQVKATDTPPVTPTGNFRPVITPNTELRRWCNGSSSWANMPSSVGESSENMASASLLQQPGEAAPDGNHCYQFQNGFGTSGAMSPPLHPPKKRKHLSGDATLASAAVASGQGCGAGTLPMQQQSAASVHVAARQLLAEERNSGLRHSSLRELLLAGHGHRTVASAASLGGSAAAALGEGSSRFGGSHDFAARRNLTEALLSPPCDASVGNQMPSTNGLSSSNRGIVASSSLSMPTPPSSKASTPDRFA